MARKQKPRNPVARALRGPALAPKKVRPLKGKGSYRRLTRGARTAPSE